jgi:hypothetical protein
MKTTERLEARRLRADRGLSMKEIAGLLRVSVSPVSLWARDIELDDAQHVSLRVRAADRRGSASSEVARERRRGAQASGRRFARHGGSLHLAGCMLFWAEGSKDRNAVVFIQEYAGFERPEWLG